VLLKLVFAGLDLLLAPGRRGLTAVGFMLPRVRNGLPLVGPELPLVRDGLTLVSPAFALIGQAAAFIGGMLTGDHGFALGRSRIIWPGGVLTLH
jgi:hypothetical protein